MNRYNPLACLFVAAMCGAGCVETDQGLAILGDYGPNPTTCMTQMAMSLTMAVPLPMGTYDIGVALGGNLGYKMSPLVINNLPHRPNSSGVELNNVDLVGFDVNVVVDPASPLAPFLPPNQAGLTQRSVAIFGGQVVAGGGVATASAEMLGVNFAQTLAGVKNLIKVGPQVTYPEVTLEVRARGTGTDGTQVSNPIDFPVRICSFCLGQKIGFPGVSAVDPNTMTVDDCPTMLMSTQVQKSCYPQQDSPSSCCQSNGVLLCGSSIPTTS